MKSVAGLSTILLTIALMACSVKQHSDLAEAGFHGPVSVISEINYVNGIPDYKPVRHVYHYDPQGQLIKLEKYNFFDEGNPTLNHTSNYHFTDGRKKGFSAVDRKGKIIETGDYTWVSDQEYQTRIFFHDGYEVRYTTKLDPKGRLMEKKSVVEKSGKEIVNNSTSFSFNAKGDIASSKMMDHLSGNNKDLLWKPLLFDAQKNITELLFIEAGTGDTIGKITRTFTYR